MKRIALALIASSVVASLALSQEPRTATVTFQRPTQYTDGSAISQGTDVAYRVYQGARGTEKQRVAEITGTTATINSGLQPGETCWQVSAVANGVESALSNEGCKSFAWPATEAVTITVQ